LIAVIATAKPQIEDRHVRRAVVTIILVSGVSFAIARRHWIYRDAPAAQLNSKLDGIFPGAKFIRTNARTYEYLRDLQVAIAKVRAKKYMILPDMAAYWVNAGQLNPICIDWPYYVELSRDELVSRVERDLERQKGKSVILLEKVDNECLANGFCTLRSQDYPILRYVHENFRKVDATKFFDILE
jgi:hypothetical protein